MSYDEHNKWVIIEVNEAGDVFVAPEKLELPADWTGNIIWFVFTHDWELSTDGVVFSPDSGFGGAPQPDETRTGCWSTAATNDRTATFHYTLNVNRVTDPSKKVSHIDPVVENDPPPVGHVPEHRPARRREVARRQNAS